MELIKKAACILFAAMVSTTFVKAQDLCVEPGTWSLEAGIAPTSLAGTYSTTEQVFRPFGEIFAVIFTFGLYTPQQSYDKYYTSPGLSLRGGYQINKWLMVTTDLNYGTARAERIKEEGGPVERTDHWKTTSLLPGVHFTYYNKKKWQLYSGLAAGAAYIDCDDDDQASFTFEIIPFGLRFGKKVYGSAELNWGTEFGPSFRGGDGIRF